jgi:hypothetical protein
MLLRLVLQIATIEHAHQHALGLMRQEWQLELDHLRKDVAARRHLLILQVCTSCAPGPAVQLQALHLPAHEASV